MDNKEKGNVGITILITILVLAVIGLGGYLVYDKVIDKKDDTVNNSDQKDDNSKEVEVMDQLLINDIRNKIMIVSHKRAMSSISMCKKSNCTLSGFDFNKNILDGELDNSEKTAMILYNIYNDGQFSSLISEQNDTNFSESEYETISYNKTMGDSENIEIKFETINDFSKQIFGIEASKTNFLTKKHCPNFLYDSKSNKYFVGTNNCGGASPTQIMYYINKYTTKDDNLYAYVRVGTFALQSDSSQWVVLNNAYLNDENVSGESILYNVSLEDAFTENNDIKFEINKDNYTKFQEYVFEFKKDTTGNYYFVKTIKK